MYKQDFKNLCSQVGFGFLWCCFWFFGFFYGGLSVLFWLFTEVMSEDNKSNQQNKSPC